MRAVTRLLGCGHVAREVSNGRCWPCYLADLRAEGLGERADRLERYLELLRNDDPNTRGDRQERLKELQDDGQLSWDHLVANLVDSYEER